MEIIFHSHANKTHFHKKGCAPSLISKVRVFGTRSGLLICYVEVASKTGGFCVELHYGTVRGTLSFLLRLHRKVGQNSSLKTVP